MSVISRTTKGKKERIELAATEKAKVWTSVRSRYFSVEKRSEWEGRAGLEREVRWRRSLDEGGAEMGGCAMGDFMVAEESRAGRNPSSSGGYRGISLSLLKL